MENIGVLIIVVIAFNLIRTVMKAIRGGQSATRKTVPERIVRSPEESPVDPWVHDAAYFDSGFSEQADYDSDYDDEEDKEEEEDMDSGETEERYTVPLVERERYRSSSVASGLKQALTQKDPLVAAFIFHEIFGQPLAMRRKR